ncbi:2-oxoglutarate dehydrogenase complex dihydrolipoyllysine-residue succinyltransferase [Azospirillum sp. CT11-132]|uniref:2-oxoglutarate dehydrogenase complex dihydrolipoyllysine-residue succinyltransferase n=1 Tax=Azospirillum sp. CT11-132 TaxID=3396317 RepID=UPI0039A6ECC6
MATDIKVPTLGESVSEATVARWLKKAGEAVAMDEALVELETDKVTLEVNASAAGVLAEIVAPEGANVEVGALLGVINEGASAGAAPAAAAPAAAPAPAAAAPAPAAAAPAASAPGNLAASGPAARKLADEKGIDGSSIAGSGKDGRVTKGDVLAAPAAKPAAPAAAPAPKMVWAAGTQGDRPRAAQEERVRMTRLRQRIAERLKEAQNSAAMLTTFNEVDMSAAIALRAEYKDYFEKRHKVRLGFMSFFVKAAVQALKEIPAVNAEIDGTDIVYKNYYDIGVAVGTPQGLVVPVVRDADKLDFAGVEGTIAALGKKGRDGKLSMDELTGGTFTISNGGVYGSLMSTPIINPPQSAILGMHKTMDRAVVVGGKIEVRPMMYLALSYDHRIIDGKEAVTFLVRIKELIEDPRRLLLDV